MDIRKISIMENEWERFQQIYSRKKQDVVFYGAGQGADWVFRLLSSKGIVPDYMVDQSLCGNVKERIPVIHYDAMKNYYKDKNVYVIVAAPKYEAEILEELGRDFPIENLFSFECELYCSFLPDIPAYRNWMCENEPEIHWLYGILADDFSRRTLENVLKGRISGKLSYFREVFVPGQYFPKDIMNLSGHETFIDAGAYIGDTATQIAALTDGRYQKIYCFEPDASCCKTLLDNTKNLHDITVIPKGAWNKKEKLYMQADSEHGASAVGAAGNYAIEMDCIDNCIGTDVQVTHVKMDIEGAEAYALWGGVKLIRRCKPKLAICVYHKKEDIVEIPKLILSIAPDYKLYIRHHNVSGTETVLYAVPQ